MNINKLYQSYYTKSSPIIEYMVYQLNVLSGLRIFEPCAGEGVFIDALNGLVKNLSIDINELNPSAFNILCNKYANFPNISIANKDALLDTDLQFQSNFGGIYDRIIANPPYGGWQDYEKRYKLKKLYPFLYVKETYIVFLYLSINLLRKEGELVFIIPDTFLNLHMHTKFRHYLLTNTLIKEICLFPSSFFPGVNFGYSNLCIISLKKADDKYQALKNKFSVITGLKNVNELTAIVNKNLKPYHKQYTFTQEKILSNIDHALFISDDIKITELINKCNIRVSDIAYCVTGFYSGNDKKYLKVLNNSVKNGKKYEKVCKDSINDFYRNNKNILYSNKNGFTINFVLKSVKMQVKLFEKPETTFLLVYLV